MNDKLINNDEENDTDERSSDSRLPIVKRERKSLSLLKHPRQKFCPRWETEFPWLRGQDLDKSLGHCIICDKRLVCKKSHLERHQNSFKHKRLSSYEFEGTGTNTVTEFLECGKRDAQDDVEYVELDIDNEQELHTTQQDKKERPKKKNFPRTRQKANGDKIDRSKLLKCIDRDRNSLNEFYFALQKQAETSIAAQQQRDSFDLFFDSVSASVKTLPPKLAAEIKGQISQIIAEFEIRAICEREAALASAANFTATTAVAEISNNGTSSTPHITYSFNKK